MYSIFHFSGGALDIQAWCASGYPTEHPSLQITPSHPLLSSLEFFSPLRTTCGARFYPLVVGKWPKEVHHDDFEGVLHGPFDQDFCIGTVPYNLVLKGGQYHMALM